MVDMVKETFDIGIYDIADFSIAYPLVYFFLLLRHTPLFGLNPYMQFRNLGS